MRELPEEAKAIMRQQDWQTFTLALVVIVGGGYALVFAPQTADDVRLAVAGFMGSVVTYFFGRQIGNAAAAQMIRAANGHPGQTVETTSTPTEVTTKISPEPRTTSPES